MQITQDELLEALRTAETGPGEAGMTVTELCEKLGKGSDTVRRRLKELIAGGKCAVVRVRRQDMAGRDMLVPGYQFKP
jgi:predicted ArsR family transcriptional regulator